MIRAAGLGALALAALALAAPAAAKELTKADLCGPERCVTITEPGTLANVPIESYEEVTPPAAQGFHTLRLTLDAGGGKVDTATVRYLPREGIVAWRFEDGTTRWSKLAGAEASTMHELARGLEPFPAPAAWEVARPPAAETSPRVPQRLVAGGLLGGLLALGALAVLVSRRRAPGGSAEPVA